MGLFGRFFNKWSGGRNNGLAPSHARCVEVQSFGSQLLRLPALDHFGLYSRSSNGRYTLVWRDGNGSRGGARESGEGRYVLLDGNRLVVDGRMERPNDGKVADNGTFVLNDWRFSSDLSGIFWAFRADGTLILSRSFTANLFNNGLYTDGSLACCQTANSPTQDGCLLTIFDLAAGREIGAFFPESGWANEYEFLPASEALRLCYSNDVGAFTYRFTGEFLDREAWTEAQLNRGNLTMVRRLMDEAGNLLKPEFAQRLLASVDASIHQHSQDPRWQAFGWRLKGEILEAIGELADAIQAYERALEFEPRIGAKRHMERLKKAVQRDGN